MPEIVIIVLAIALLFGSKNIINLARSMGRMSGEFKKGKIEIEKELREAEAEASGEKNADGGERIIN